MAPFFILIVSFILLRGIGWLGVKQLSSWREAGRFALVVMFLFTGISHFSNIKYDYMAMLPDPLPKSLWLIYLTGMLEIAGAIGLLIPRFQRIAGICLVIFLIAVFPANAYAALNEVPFRGRAPTPLWLRTPIQIFFVWMVWWTSIKRTNSRV
jgi:uncharacterized membrane protein